MANSIPTEAEGTAKSERRKSVMEFAERRGNYPREPAPRNLVVYTLLILIAWAIFILLYALYWSTGFNTFQNVIVTLVSLFITGLVVGLIWVILGPRSYWNSKQ